MGRPSPIHINSILFSLALDHKIDKSQIILRKMLQTVDVISNNFMLHVYERKNNTITDTIRYDSLEHWYIIKTLSDQEVNTLSTKDLTSFFSSQSKVVFKFIKRFSVCSVKSPFSISLYRIIRWGSIRTTQHTFLWFNIIELFFVPKLICHIGNIL